MTELYRPPVLLATWHELDDFTCRSDEQTQWPRHHARQSAASGATKVLVVTRPGEHRVDAYYAWCLASVRVDEVPARMRKGAGRYPQPVALLARLGVDMAHESRGLGTLLLQDVIIRTRALGGEIGCRGLLVHAETPEARDYYLHLVPEFQPSPTDELHLFLLMKDIRRTLG